MAGIGSGGLAADVAEVGAAVDGGVGIEDFLVKAGAGDADDIAFADDGCGVHDHDDEVFVMIFSVADEGKNAVVGVIAIYPFEALPMEIDFVESGLGGENAIEVGD